jgi:hypothetical protein
MEMTANGPVLGLSDERLKQEGYWFWQEFIAETISKFCELQTPLPPSQLISP